MQVEDLLQQCTVKLSIPGQLGWGTGFFVAPGLILTCAHVIKALATPNRVRVRWQQQLDFAEAELVHRVIDLDLALLKFTPGDDDLPCVYLDEEVQAGQNLYFFGYPDEDFEHGCPVTGSCEGFTGDVSPLIKFKQAQVRPGMSGSALLNRQTRKICGMVKFTRNRSIDLGGGAIPTREILEQFPQLRDFQQEFHGQDWRWRNSIINPSESKGNQTLTNQKSHLLDVPPGSKTSSPIISLGMLQVGSVLASPMLARKFNPEIYVNRAIEQDIEKFLKKTIRINDPHCFLLISPAGCGKTNLLCHIAQRSCYERPTFLLTANQLRITKQDSVLGGLRRCFIDGGFAINSECGVLDYILDLSRNTKLAITILIDGINEYHDPAELRRELEYILEATAQTGIRFLISCRDYYWGLFEGGFWNSYTRVSSSVPGEERTKRQLANFSYAEDSDAFEKYFAYFKITVRPEGNARDQFRHPLLLRFFCETYCGQNIGLIRDVRLKDLFNCYWNNKLLSIAERMVVQGEVGIVAELANFVGNCLTRIARQMLDANNRILPVRIAQELTDSSFKRSVLQSPYGRILDEYIILEELSELDDQNDIKVAFVFEEFMEYAMARSLLEKWSVKKSDEILDEIIEIIHKYESFSQVLGVILYVALMLKEKRKIALWPLLIGQGDQWKAIVIEAFRKLPREEIDDGVFDAIIDLLHVESIDIRADALELLKYGRLKRIPPERLIQAVGELVTDDNLKVRRRAIHALESCPPEFAIPLIEKSFTTKMHRVTDQYPVVKYSLKALAKFDSQDIYIPMARAVASYWHGDGYCADALKTLKGREQEFIPLLFCNDVLVRLGAIEFLGGSSCEKAVEPLEQISRDDSSYPGDLHNRLPDYFNNDSLIRQGQWAKEKGISLVQYMARGALKSLHENIAQRKKQEEQLQAIEDAIKSKAAGVPVDIDKLSEYEDISVVVKAIKAGLDSRSDRKWRVTYRSNRFPIGITIKSPPNRLLQGNMTVQDRELLAKLLNLKTVSNEGVFVEMGYRWKEYIYRSWGVTPKVTGWTEPYWD
ncbi:MAG: trypsin-like peptidase domain-containing protein [Crocosphaera sp.]